MLKDLDPFLVVYIIGGVILVSVSYVVFAAVTDTARLIRNKNLEEEKKKREEARKLRQRAS